MAAEISICVAQLGQVTVEEGEFIGMRFGINSHKRRFSNLRQGRE
jgi:hypothetical protein